MAVGRGHITTPYHERIRDLEAKLHATELKRDEYREQRDEARRHQEERDERCPECHGEGVL